MQPETNKPTTEDKKVSKLQAFIESIRKTTSEQKSDKDEMAQIINDKKEQARHKMQSEKVKQLNSATQPAKSLNQPSVLMQGNSFGAVQTGPGNIQYINTGVNSINTSGQALYSGMGPTVTSAWWSNAQSHTDVISLFGENKQEIVRISNAGEVIWGDGINVTDAAKAFGRSLRLGTEQAAKITYNVKQQMRDAVFEELISMAKEKGSITSEDLTYLHQAAKIMDKLKGPE